MKPSIETKAMSYDHAHEVAVSMGYPSLTEALEHLDELRQSSAVLPSEAMIEAGAKAFCETQSLNPHKLAEVVYTAMRATTPTAPVPEGCSCKSYPHTCHLEARYYDQQATAPVQDDDAERRLRAFCRDAWGDEERLDPSSNKSATMGDLRKLLASRLSPTPETGLVEALRQLDLEISALNAAHEAMQTIGRNDEAYEINIGLNALEAFRTTLNTSLSNVSLSDGRFWT